MNSQETKRCPRCTLTLPLDNFVKNKFKARGVGSYCKPCKQARKKEPRKLKLAGPIGAHYCSSCKTWKAIDDFGKGYGKKKRKDGKSYRCRACEATKERVKQRERRARKKAERLARLALFPVVVPDDKLCTGVCGERKPLSAFGKRKGCCRECQNIRAKERRASLSPEERKIFNARVQVRRMERLAINPDLFKHEYRDPQKKAANARWNKYQITESQWEEMLGPDCDRCGTAFPLIPDVPGKGCNPICIDHDHDHCGDCRLSAKSCGSSDALRGVLCRACSNKLTVKYCREHQYTDPYLVRYAVRRALLLEQDVDSALSALLQSVAQDHLEDPSTRSRATELGAILATENHATLPEQLAA